MNEEECLLYNQRLMAALRTCFPVKVNDFAFSLVMAHLTLNREPVTFGWHSHQYFELGIPLDQPMIYEIDGFQHQFSASDPYFIFIPAGMRHIRQTVLPDSSCLGLVIDIHCAANSMMSKFLHLNRRNQYRMAVSSEAQQLLGKIKAEYQSGQQAFTGNLLFFHLHEFILELLHHSFPDFFDNGQIFPRNTDLIDMIERYLNNNLCSQNLLKELGKLCGISERHINRIFFQKYGISIKKFVVRERLKAASHELLNSQKAIKTVALECGFNNFSYFTRHFRAHYNLSPSEYRNRG